MNENDPVLNQLVNSRMPPQEAAPQEAPSESAESPPMKYEVPWGDTKREFTPEQIRSTFERYGQLNYRHAQLKPIIDVAEQVINELKAPPDKVAEFIKQRIAGDNEKATETAARAVVDSQRDIDAELTKWEQDNAAQLPPGYKDLFKAMKMQESGFSELKQMLSGVLQQGTQIAQRAAATEQEARARTISAIRQTIANNLTKAQQETGLPDEAAKEFMVFAGERGYTLEDFSDPSLTTRVVADYKNALNSKEFDRLREVNRRRQAYTASLGASPSGATTSGDQKKDADLDLINRIVESKMRKG